MEVEPSKPALGSDKEGPGSYAQGGVRGFSFFGFVFCLFDFFSPQVIEWMIESHLQRYLKRKERESLLSL